MAMPFVGTAAILLSRILAVVLVVVVRVKFDASFRPATTDGTARLASAAATLEVLSSSANDDDAANNKHCVCMRLGAKPLWDSSSSSCLVQTSGEAEFEGLLLALEGIWRHRDRIQEEVIVAEASSSSSSSTHQDNHPNVTISIQVQGDCKTAIQQMQGRSRSRRLAPQWQRAKALVAQIPWPIEFQHVPRQQNVLCDRLCHGILTTLRNDKVQCISQDLVGTLDQTLLDTATTASSIPDTFLHWEKTLLPGSCRLTLYAILTRLTWYHGDYSACYETSRQMQRLADAMLKESSHAQRAIREATIQLKVQAIQYEVATLRKLGRDKDATKVERRAKTLLFRHGCALLENKDASGVVESLRLDILEWTKESQTDCFLDFDQIFAENISPQMMDETLLRTAAQRLFEESLSAVSEPSWVTVSKES